MRTKPPLEKHIEAEIIRNLRTLGFAVTKTSQARPSKVTLGVPDLYAAHPIWKIRLWIEVKRPGNKTSAYQDAWHETERRAGGHVMVATSVTEVIAELRRLGAPIIT